MVKLYLNCSKTRPLRLKLSTLDGKGRDEDWLSENFYWCSWKVLALLLGALTRWSKVEMRLHWEIYHG